MTRSSQDKHSPQGAKKAWKRTCIAAGMPHSDAAKFSSSVVQNMTGPRVSATERRNPGRMDGVQWKADSFICPDRVDGSEWEPYNDNSYTEEELYDDTMIHDDEHINERRHIVSLLDIAKPAKLKGIAKDLEVVKRKRQQMFLEDENDWEIFSLEQEDEWEEWEEIYTLNSMKQQSRPSYSAILQNKR